MQVAAVANAEFVDARAAAALLGSGVDVRAVDRLARRGLIAVRELPGVRARYRKSDVEDLARSAVRTAESRGPAETRG